MRQFKKILDEFSLDNVKEMSILDDAEGICIAIRRKPAAENSGMAESRAKADEVFKSLIEKMEEIEKSVEEQEEETPEECEYCEHDCENEDDDDEEISCVDFISALDDKINDVMGEIADIKENVNNLMFNIPASFDLLETRLGIAPNVKKKTGKEILDAIKTLESEACSHKWALSEVLAELKMRVSDNEEMLHGLVKDIADIKDRLSPVEAAKSEETSDEPVKPAKKPTKSTSTKKSTK